MIYSRQNAFGLRVALNKNEKASGDLFWDDGDSVGTLYSQLLFTSNIPVYKYQDNRIPLVALYHN